jgi:SAM-dependent methyltransferase
MKCRHCDFPLELSMVDLGSAPPSNAYLTTENLHRAERYFPLRVLVCGHCWLAQTEDFADANELFDDNYAYFSSYSASWLEHCERYVDEMVGRFLLNQSSLVIEVAANDGYLLDFVARRGIPCIGVEPTRSTAGVAKAKGHKIHEEFFGERFAKELADRGEFADLAIANNVLAHVPNINDFILGFNLLLKPEGVATFEFPHLLNLLAENQFDTIYHEHFSYLSLSSIEQIFQTNGLSIFDVQELETHGGSLRIFAQRIKTGIQPVSDNVRTIIQRELEFGICKSICYADFQARAERVKDDFVSFLIKAKHSQKTVAAYGAAAKGNTLMNFAGIRPDLISYVVDKNPAKQGKFMPGSRIPIKAPEMLQKHRPDFLVILPWNIAAEVREQNAWLEAQGTRFVTAVPYLKVL